MTSRVFDSESLEEVRCYQADRPLNSASLSPLKEQIVCGGGQEARDVTTTSARAGRFEICFFDRVYSEEIGRLKGHFGPVNTLAFHPSGKSLCSGGEDGYVRIYHFDHNYLNYGQ
jgi:translation initiation factor 3 subunit I